LPPRRRARRPACRGPARRRRDDPDLDGVAERRRRGRDRAVRVASAESVSMARVVRINVTPVKGLGLLHPEGVMLTERGVGENRRYYLVSGWRLYNGKDH